MVFSKSQKWSTAITMCDDLGGNMFPKVGEDCSQLSNITGVTSDRYWISNKKFGKSENNIN